MLHSVATGVARETSKGADKGAPADVCALDDWRVFVCVVCETVVRKRNSFRVRCGKGTDAFYARACNKNERMLRKARVVMRPTQP